VGRTSKETEALIQNSRRLRPNIEEPERGSPLNTVIDSSVLVAALVDTGPQGVWAEEIIANGVLHAPELVLVETTNILRRLERDRHITDAAANAAQDDLMQLHLELFSFAPFAERVWELRHTITNYDAWYVAVAEAPRLPLATLDRRLARARGLSSAFVTPR
jgi:predicted nucleic acid-binding protein